MRIIREKLSHLFLKEPRKFSPQVKLLGVLSKNQLFLVILVTVLTRPKFLFGSHAHFDVVQGLEYVVQLKGIPVNLCHPLFPGDIKNRRNSRNIQKHFIVIRNFISSLEMAGHVQKVNFRPLVVSPLNVVPKANGSPRLTHDLNPISLGGGGGGFRPPGRLSLITLKQHKMSK